MATKNTNNEHIIAENLNKTNLPPMGILAELKRRNFNFPIPEFEEGKPIKMGNGPAIFGVYKGEADKKAMKEFLDVVYTYSGCDAKTAASNLLSIFKLAEAGINPANTIKMGKNEYVLDIDKRVAATIYGKVVADLNDLKGVKLTKDQVVKLLVDRLRLVPGNAVKTVVLQSDCGEIEVNVDDVVKVIIKNLF